MPPLPEFPDDTAGTNPAVRKGCPVVQEIDSRTTRGILRADDRRLIKKCLLSFAGVPPGIRVESWTLGTVSSFPEPIFVSSLVIRDRRRLTPWQFRLPTVVFGFRRT